LPAGSPFTRLCQQLHLPPSQGRADLHLHTTFSDGSYTPAQVVDLARRSGLAAIAITDHDTLDGIGPARAAAPPALEVIAGVEITCEFLGRELHLLGFFVDLDDAPLLAALADIAGGRRDRFLAMVERLAGRGIRFSDDVLASMPPTSAPGRRHLAQLLVQTGHASTIQEAFQQFLGDRGPIQVAKRRLAVESAIELVRYAGGVAAWAHPPYDDSRTHLRTLRDMGMGAVEVYFPSCRPGHIRPLRDHAESLGLAVTGGSDCHGPEPLRRTVGSFGIGTNDLDRLRLSASTPAGAIP